MIEAKAHKPKEWRQYIRQLRECLPTSYPVEVRRIDASRLPFSLGDTQLVGSKRRRFLIRISKDLEWNLSLWVLGHEYAHAMTWQVPSTIEPDDHGPIFWQAKGRAFAAMGLV